MSTKMMIARRPFCFILVCFVLVLGCAVPCFAQQTATNTSNRLTADVLKTTLFVRTAEEGRFCDYVIQRRDAGTLPPSLLYAVYRKAMAQDRVRRFAYFRNALEIVCRQEGIVLNPTASTAAPARTASSVPAWIPSFLRGLF